MKKKSKYLRICRRCNEFYRTDHRLSKFCKKCVKHNGGFRIKTRKERELCKIKIKKEIIDANEGLRTEIIELKRGFENGKQN